MYDAGLVSTYRAGLVALEVRSLLVALDPA